MNIYNKDKSIALLGFMGVGKSTVGKILAERLQIPYVDMDEVIEKQEQSTITDIFKHKGEAAFREIESRLLRVLLDGEPAIIATGGGVPCSDKNIKWVNEKAVSVTLVLGVDRILKRIENDDARPLVAGKSKKELRKWVVEKLRVRNKYYNKGKIQVRAIGSPQRIAARIISKLDRHK